MGGVDDLLLGHTKIFLVSSDIWKIYFPVRETKRFDRFPGVSR